MAILSSAVSALSHVLPGFAGPVRRRAGRAVHHPAAGQAADDRRLRVQEVDRPAVRVPGQLADAGGELPADDVRRADRAVRGRPGLRAGAQPAADRARRPRAELQHVDGADGRLVGRQPVRLDLRPASARCGARCTAAPTRPCSRCWRRSVTTAATSRSSSRKAKDNEDGFLLMGFGHRVYKNYDPRARSSRKRRDKLLAKLGRDDDLSTSPRSSKRSR